MLFVKDRDAQGPLRVSEEFVPNAEVPRIVCEEIGGCVNPFLGDKPIATDGRDDPFYVDFVPWQFRKQKRSEFVIWQRLRLTGRDPYKLSNWRLFRRKQEKKK